MAVDDRLRDVDQLPAVVLRVVPQHLEGAVGIDRVPCHQDALRLLDQGPPAKGTLEALVLREPLEGDVDRALQLVGIAVDDVGEDAALRSFVHVRRIPRGQQGDHGARGFTDDLRDQLQGMLRAQTEADERYVGTFPLCRGSDFLDVDLAGDDLVAAPDYDLSKELQPVAPPGISVTLNERGDALPESERLTLRNSLREQTSRIRSLVEQLLDLSRLDLGAIHISPEPVRLRPKIEELVRTLTEARPNAVTIAVPPDLEAVVDPAALDRMLSNLIANSLRHGQPPVTITAEGQDRHLRLAIEDRGGGVSDEFVPCLFDRFAREPRAPGEGSGLGLAIAQAYARAHGGEIVYEPAVPHGARFELVIPLRGYGDERTRIE
jgi:signal transduction histidine kinase